MGKGEPLRIISKSNHIPCKAIVVVWDNGTPTDSSFMLTVPDGRKGVMTHLGSPLDVKKHVMLISRNLSLRGVAGTIIVLGKHTQAV